MRWLLAAALLCVPMFAQAQTRVAMLGDSITDAGGIAAVTRNFPSRLQDLLGPNYDVDEFATSGDTVALAAAAWAASIDNHGYDWLVVLIGVNDIVGANADGTTTFNAADVIVADALSQSMQVVWLTVLPAGGYSGCSAADSLEIVEFNALVMARASVDAVNAYSSMADSCTGTMLDRGLDSYDGLHTNNAGAQTLAQLAYTAIVTP